jgi:phospholipid transport system substrate-binding protein
MRRFWIVGAVVWLVFTPALAKATDAGELIRGLTEEAIGILESTEQDSQERKTKLESLFRSSMDIPFVGKFVVGRYWRQMNEAEKAEYMEAFEHYVLSVYAGRLNEYSGESIRVLDTRPVDEIDTIVTSQLTRKDRAPVAVDWRVRQNGNDAKVIDVSVEGVSMAMTQRQEFNSILQREGVGGLIKRLESPQPRDPGPPR